MQIAPEKVIYLYGEAMLENRLLQEQLQAVVAELNRLKKELADLTPPPDKPPAETLDPV